MSTLPDVFADPEDSQLVADAKKDKPEDHEFSYTERDVILYNLGVGATAKDLQWTYESHEEFGALPTFGVIPQFAASSGVSLGWLPNFNPVRHPDRIQCTPGNLITSQAKLLHGEQYLAIKSPIPTEGNFVNETRFVHIRAILAPIPISLHRLLEVLDKGKAASVTTIVYTKDVTTGNVIFENQITVFIRGAGGFGGKRSGRGIEVSIRTLAYSGLSEFAADRGAATAVNTPPNRQPDAVIEEKTSASQAALYRSEFNIWLYLLAFLILVCRLSGDYNPLHVSRTDMVQLLEVQVVFISNTD